VAGMAGRLSALLNLEGPTRKPGRLKVPKETRELTRRISRQNPMWGAPGIHGELHKLGIDIGDTSVSKYMVHPRGAISPAKLLHAAHRRSAVGGALTDPD
jgi:hypothetical protein